jgi:cytochrome P450
MIDRLVANQCPAGATSRSPDPNPTEGRPAVHPPQMPTSTWFRGNGRDLGTRGLEFFTQCEQTGGLVQIRIWHKSAYIATDPAFIEQILLKQAGNFGKPLGLQVVRPAFGNGLLTAEGDPWIRNRRMIQPAFQSRKLDHYAEVAAILAAQRIVRYRDGDVVNIHQEMVELCMHVLMETLFGEAEREGEPLIFELTEAIQDFMFDYSKFGFPPFPNLMPTSSNLRFRRAVRAIDNWLLPLIARRRKDETGGEGLLSMMMRARDKAGQGLSDKQLRDETVTMFLAGHETVAAALSWTIHLVATHPDVQKRLIGEIDAGPPSSRGLGTVTFPFLDKVIEEGLRLYPPVYRIGRVAVRDCVIGGFLIPKGANVLIPQWAIQRSARYYPDPLVFRPARWNDSMRESLPRFAYCPFGGGPRICPGGDFSFREMEMVLRALFEHAELESVASHLEPFEGLTLKPNKGKLEVRIRIRDPEILSRKIERIGR